MTMEELERAAIIATLKSVGGNRRLASEQLGIGERTLYRKLKEYQIDA
jgi:DNA-binding NtrC family response regulator